MMVRLVGWCLVACVMLLQACGGGGGGGGGADPEPTPVSITTQPRAVTVVAGAKASFTVAAAGSPTLRYQWKADGVSIAGATGATYTIAAAAAELSGTAYTVQVSNDRNSVLSQAAVLTVLSPPQIEAQPASAQVAVGATHTLSVTAAGSAPLAYQWRLNGAHIAGATTSSYTTPALALENSGARYDVVVSNAAGSVTSAAATLTVELATRSATLDSAPLARLQVDLTAQFAAVGLGAGGSFTATQTAGPAVDFNVASGFLNVIGPADSGADRSVGIEVAGASGKLQLTLNYPTLRVAVANDAGDRDTDTGPRVAVKGKVVQQGTGGTANDVVSGFAALGFAITAPSLPKAIDIHVATRTDGRNVTGLFNYDPQTGIATIKPERAAELTAYVGTRPGVTFTVSGPDLHTKVSLIHAPSRIKGRVVDANGNALSSLQGRKLTLEGGLTSFSDVATIGADGSFVFPAVPVESFNLELRDAGNALLGQASAVISSAGEELTLDLVVVATAGTATAQAQGLSPRGPALAPAAKQPYLGAVERSRLHAGGASLPVPARDPRRRKVQAATPASCESQPGHFSVTAAAENAPITCTGSHVLAKGTQQIKVTITVDTAEFPGYSPVPGNPYNDRWAYNVQLGGGKLFTGAGRVNDTHATRGSIKLADECVNIAVQTSAADLQASVSIQSTNIGDSALPTTVKVVFGPCAGLQVSEFKLDRTSPDVSGRLFFNNKAPADEVRYHIALPQGDAGYTTLQFPATIKYLPVEATVTEVKLQIEHAGGTIDLIDNALAEPNTFSTSPGTISFTRLRIPPGTAAMFGGIATLQVTLKGTLGGSPVQSDSTGAFVAGDTKRPTNFLPFFEASQRLALASTRRYSGRDEVVGASANCATCGGLDGWALKETLDKLNAVDWVFNDISAQHTGRTTGGRSILDHSGHGSGREVDVRYWDDKGVQGNGPLNGFPTPAGNAILLLIDDVCKASRKNADGSLKTAPADNPQYTVLVNWINENRTRIGDVMARTDVSKVHIPEIGSKIHAALKLGHCPDDEVARIVPAEWAPGVDKLSPAPPHNDHWHVNFVQ